jgi:hypothetical protein
MNGRGRRETLLKRLTQPRPDDRTEAPINSRRLNGSTRLRLAPRANIASANRISAPAASEP